MYVTLEAAAVNFGVSSEALALMLGTWALHMRSADDSFPGMTRRCVALRKSSADVRTLYLLSELEQAVAFDAAQALGFQR